MSANLNYDNEGRASVAYTGDLPWHREGQKIENAFTMEEAIKEANLDYEVELRPLHIYDGDNVSHKVPNRQAVVRKDNNVTLGVVGNKYSVLQPREAFGFFDGLFGEGKCRYDVAGVLGNGERMWLLAKIEDNEPLEIVPNDVLEKYLCLTTAFDGSGATIATPTPVRVVCQNTVNVVLKDVKAADRGGIQNFVRVKHTGDCAARLKDAGQILKNTGIWYDEAKMHFQKFAKTDLTVKQTRDYVATVLYNEDTANENVDEWKARTRNTVNSVMDLVDGGRGSDIKGVRGTLWGAYNALTEYADHTKVYRGTKTKTGIDSRKSFEQSQFGSGRYMKERAFNVAVETATRHARLQTIESAAPSLINN